MRPNLLLHVVLCFGCVQARPAREHIREVMVGDKEGAGRGAGRTASHHLRHGDGGGGSEIAPRWGLRNREVRSLQVLVRFKPRRWVLHGQNTTYIERTPTRDY